MIKAWNLANSNHLRSFHVEVLVHNIWAGYNIGTSLLYTVSSTLRVLASWVNTKCKDPWNTDAYVDDYLNSTDRDLVVRLLNQDATAAEKAEEYRQAGENQRAFNEWNKIYRHTFPAYG